MENIGGVYNEKQFEVQLRENDDNSWAPAEIKYLVDFTVRFGDLITGFKIPRTPNQVFLDKNGTINGTNTNIIPGSPIYAEEIITGEIVPVTLVSKNYLVHTPHGRVGVYPHTRIRRAVRTSTSGGRRKRKTLNKDKRKTLNKDKRKTSNKGKTKKTY
jgi:hypothetical protein